MTMWTSGLGPCVQPLPSPVGQPPTIQGPRGGPPIAHDCTPDSPSLHASHCRLLDGGPLRPLLPTHSACPMSEEVLHAGYAGLLSE